MLIERLNWRYATKKMDPTRAVPDEKLNRILEAVRLAPTSSGLQPFEVIVITNPELREKIRTVSNDQSQITDGSHLLVFAAWDNYTEERIDGVLNEIIETRGAASDTLTAYYERLKSMYLPRTAEVNYAHAARQAYIALGVALTAAAFEEVDATPMEGFESDKLDAILGLRDRGLRSITLMPLGYRATEGDWLAPLSKVRREKSKLVTEIA
jgi:nitroreductase